MEVMLAMGIFVIGFAMVAGLFAAALVLQKRTIEDVQSQHIARNAGALLAGRGLTYSPGGATPPLPSGDLAAYYSATGPVDYSYDQVVPLLPLLPGRWLANDRGYPTLLPNGFDRDFYWIPLIRDSAGDSRRPNWQIYVFVLRRPASGPNFARPAPIDNWGNDPSDATDIPSVQRVTGVTTVLATNEFRFDNSSQLVRAGEWVLDNYGVIYQAIDATAGGITVEGSIPYQPPAAQRNQLWIARPRDAEPPPPATQGPSSGRRIVILSGEGIIREP